MYRKIVCFLLGTIIVNFALAQNPAELSLWPSGAPESNNIKEAEITTDNFIRNVSEGRLYIYHADKQKNTGVAVVICPGGGYAAEYIWNEGHDFAKWLAQRGITGIVLKYRLPNKNHAIPLKDAQRALRMVRANAAEWDVNPQKIGIAGFSAGGHLASTAGTHFDGGDPSASSPIEKVSCRPDFMILFYPVITMKEEFTHRGSRINLLGEGYDAKLVHLYSNEEQVTGQTPPAFLILSDDDRAVVPQNSVAFYLALKRSKVPAALHILLSGGHGWGTNPSSAKYAEWSPLLENWLKFIYSD